MNDHPGSQNLELRGVSAIAMAMGAVAFGAVAVGAFAIGALTIRRLAIRDIVIDHARFKSLTIDELSVARLRAADVAVTGSIELPDGGGFPAIRS